MVEPKVIQQQLKDLNFGSSVWNQAELRELHKIMHKDEKILECVNGMYEGGVALLVATEMRVLLIDKKPMRFLNVEDFRFDMISEIDYSHRLIAATIIVSTGSKTLKFKSYNQKRLRHFINIVQEHMSSSKKEQSDSAETQQQHLQEINKQLQMYLMAQHQQLQQQMQGNTETQPANLPKPDPKLTDYLLAQRLMEDFEKQNGGKPIATEQQLQPQQQAPPVSAQELADEARKEVFSTKSQTQSDGIVVNPVRVAYSKLPMMLRNRKFGRPEPRVIESQEQAPIAATQTTQPAA